MSDDHMPLPRWRLVALFLLGIAGGVILTLKYHAAQGRDFPLGSAVQVARYGGYGEVVAHVSSLDPPVWIVRFPDGRLVVATQEALTRPGSR